MIENRNVQGHGEMTFSECSLRPTTSIYILHALLVLRCDVCMDFRGRSGKTGVIPTFLPKCMTSAAVSSKRIFDCQHTLPNRRSSLHTSLGPNVIHENSEMEEGKRGRQAVVSQEAEMCATHTWQPLSTALQLRSCNG